MSSTSHKRLHGSWLILIACCISFIISLINFFALSSPIRQTGGAELVLVTTFIMIGLSIVMYYFRHLHKRWERVSVYTLMLILLLGTLFAAFLLESHLLVILLLIALVGWFIQVLTR